LFKLHKTVTFRLSLSASNNRLEQLSALPARLLLSALAIATFEMPGGVLHDPPAIQLMLFEHPHLVQLSIMTPLLQYFGFVEEQCP
jgi:hypothetical protein